MLIAAPYAAYRTFWRRLGAGLVDGLVFALISLAEPWLLGSGPRPATSALWWGLQEALFLGYSISLHARYGRTLGKWLMGLVVLDVGGGPITLRQAFLRDIPTVALALVSMVLYMPAMLRGEDPFETAAGSASETLEMMILSGWLLLELGTMMTNRRRRALHDFIAGTIVVRPDRFLRPERPVREEP